MSGTPDKRGLPGAPGVLSRRPGPPGLFHHQGVCISFALLSALYGCLPRGKFHNDLSIWGRKEATPLPTIVQACRAFASLLWPDGPDRSSCDVTTSHRDLSPPPPTRTAQQRRSISTVWGHGSPAAPHLGPWTRPPPPSLGLLAKASGSAGLWPCWGASRCLQGAVIARCAAFFQHRHGHLSLLQRTCFIIPLLISILPSTLFAPSGIPSSWMLGQAGSNF